MSAYSTFGNPVRTPTPTPALFLIDRRKIAPQNQKMSQAALSALLEEFGKAVELPEVKLDEAGFCMLVFGSQIAVQFSYEADEEAVNLSSFLGELPAHSALSLCSRLLQANFYGEITHGATLCLAPNESSIYLWRRVPLEGLDYRRFEKLLRDFIASAGYWKETIETTAAHPPRQEFLPASGMIPA